MRGKIENLENYLNNMKNLYTKLHAFQKEVGTIKKSEMNPYFKSRYVDINGIIEAIKPLLEKHGLVIIQPLTNLACKPAIRTIVSDIESGEEHSEIMPLPENIDPQKMGSAITYFRRYALQSLLLLEAEDDDGNNAVGNVKETGNAGSRYSNQSAGSAGSSTETQELASKVGGTVVQGKMCTDCGLPTGSSFPKCKNCYYKK